MIPKLNRVWAAAELMERNFKALSSNHRSKRLRPSLPGFHPLGANGLNGLRGMKYRETFM